MSTGVVMIAVAVAAAAIARRRRSRPGLLLAMVSAGLAVSAVAVAFATDDAGPVAGLIVVPAAIAAIAGFVVTLSTPARPNA